MPRPVPIAEQAMEIQADLEEVERDAAPIWPAARKTNRIALVEHCQRLARLIRASRREARDIAGLAEEVAA